MIRRAVDWAAAEVTVGRKCTQKIMHIGMFSTQQPYYVILDTLVNLTTELGKFCDKVLLKISP